MLRYETKKDRLKNIVNAIIPGTESETGRSIYIDLLTITDSSEDNHSLYQIKHGNFWPKQYEEVSEGVLSVKNATWDQFYVDGKDDGFPSGFRNFDEIEQFLSEEIKRIEKKVKTSIISNDFKSDGADNTQWNRVLIAWKGFQTRFLEARRNDKLIDINTAREMRNGLMN